MEEGILNFFIKKGFLLDEDILNFFSELKDEEVADRIVGKIREISGERIITKSLIDKNLLQVKEIFSNLGEDKKKIVERFFVNVSLNIEIKKEKYLEKEKKPKSKLKIPNNLQVLSPELDIPRKISVEDFVRHFRSRYLELRGLLQERKELQNLSSLDKISGQRQNISIIVIITNKRITKNKNILLEVEDLTGRGLVLVNQNKPELFEKAHDLLLDDIVGIKCSGSKDFLFANDIVFPDAVIQEKKYADKEAYALFSSDLHIGSAKFLEENFLRFIDWINGNLNPSPEIEKIKYLFLIGDNVDGVGVFPGQEELIIIKDIKEQYHKLATLLKKIRKDIRIIMCPGQHDAVRVAEPQPIINKKFAPELYEMENLTLVTNPAYVCLEEGFNVLMYHGASFHGVINGIESLRMDEPYDRPTKVVRELLKRRHLAPTHSSVVYIPEENDSLLIRKIPDIIATGEMHKLDIDSYNNIIMIANSCWQAQTPYEEKVGNHPDPCKVPLVNLKTRAIKILDFS